MRQETRNVSMGHGCPHSQHISMKAGLKRTKWSGKNLKTFALQSEHVRTDARDRTDARTDARTDRADTYPPPSINWWGHNNG